MALSSCTTSTNGRSRRTGRTTNTTVSLERKTIAVGRRHKRMVTRSLHYLLRLTAALFLLGSSQRLSGSLCHAFVVLPQDAASAARCLPFDASSLGTTRPVSTRTTTTTTTGSTPGFATTTLAALSKRELEIRRKIRQLKQEGKLKRPQDEFEDDDDDDDDDEDEDEREAYTEKIRQKLGATKSKLLGFGDDDGGSAGDDTIPERDVKESAAAELSKQKQQPQRRGQLGSLSSLVVEEDDDASSAGGYQRLTDQTDDILAAGEQGISDYDDDEDEDDDVDELDEDDLVDLVAQRMQEKRDREAREQQESLKREAAAKLAALEKERQMEQQQQQKRPQSASSAATKQTTSGVGGSWDGNSKTEAERDVYQPKSGSWGAFPRPRDISKAYGGGRRVGSGYSNEKIVSSVEETREKLQRYRVKAGIDVESEKEHAAEIEEALKIASVAMQRGIYSTAVSALEKVTKYCSTNSKVGGKVFLELAMAYEAIGRTQEAITVYTTLSRSRIEQIKNNAKRLLYGLEAMQFMKENVSSSEFSRKRAKQTFIDTTGLGNIASKFDDVYETAYIDLDRSFYKKLTQNVVRSSREARQILLRATGPGEVDRMRIVQALRSLSRHFADALQEEIEKAKPAPEPTAVMDGKPILKQPETDNELESLQMDFVLMEPGQMLENLSGEWRLQLIADKRGDGVKFFNSTTAWQQVDTETMSFEALTPQGFLTIQQQGKIMFNSKRRILRRNSVQVSGGAGLAGLFGGSRMGAVGAIMPERQVVTVDSALLVTRGVPRQRGLSNDDEKDYFAVWRRVEPGTFSEKKP